MARVRISDIAKEAGVSPATVSRYLNNRPGAMTEETKARIAEVIERTGYRPNSAARSLRTDRSYAYGLILADIRNPFSSAMLEALSTRAAQDGYSLMTAVSGNDPAAEGEAVDRLVNAGVDGLIINTCGGNEARIKQADASTPVMLLDRDIEDSGLDLVTSNNAELVVQLVDELVGSGCGYCCLVTEHNDTSIVRRRRSIQFMHELRQNGVRGTLLPLDVDPHEAAQQLNHLKREAERSSLGLIAVNGLVFLRVVEAINAAGLTVPDQVHLATFDDYAWTRVLFGGVTTAAQDTQAMADAIVDQLAARVEGGAEPVRITVPGRIIRRASTGAGVLAEQA